MNKLGEFCLALCFLFAFTNGQIEEGPERVIPERPQPTRGTHLNRVTGGVPRVRVMSSGNKEETADDLGNEETPEVAGRPHGVTVRSTTTLRINGKSARVTENPVEITTKHCPECPIEIHHSDTNIQKYARNATDIYKARKEIPANAVLRRVYDVKRLVLNGIRYDFKVDYSYSLAGSNMKHMATCHVEVILHHSRRLPSINARPCKKPRMGVEPEGPAEEELPKDVTPVPMHPRRE